MRVLYLFALIAFGWITSAWPHPGDLLEPIPDLGSVFNVFSWPATVEQNVAQPESAECPVEGNLETPADSDTTEGNQLGSTSNYPLDTNLFSEFNKVEEIRTAPPCGPDDAHYRVCCFELWGAPGILGSCTGGTCDLNFASLDEMIRKNESKTHGGHSFALLYAC